VVVDTGADVGFAFDGDADRCLGVTRTGGLVDGDQILAILTLAARDSGRLVGDTVVGTVMTNLGFVQAMERERITAVRTAVGDRYILSELRGHGFVLGGEQTGQVIMTEHATTGDGVLTALQITS